MRLLKAVLAGFFVMAVGLFTALVLAVSALAVFLGRRLRGIPAVAPNTARTPPRARPGGDTDAIDIEATEVPTRSNGS